MLKPLKPLRMTPCAQCIGRGSDPTDCRGGQQRFRVIPHTSPHSPLSAEHGRLLHACIKYNCVHYYDEQYSRSHILYIHRRVRRVLSEYRTLSGSIGCDGTASSRIPAGSRRTVPSSLSPPTKPALLIQLLIAHCPQHLLYNTALQDVTMHI